MALTTNSSVRLVKEKCFNFLRLKDGWYDGDGDTIKFETIREVYKLIDIAQQNNLYNMEVNAELDGSITLSLYYEDYMMDILTYTRDDNVMWLQKATEEVFYKDQITQKEIIDHIINFKEKEIRNE